MNTPTSTTLPIPPDLFSAIAGLGGCALFVLIIYGFLIPTGHNHVAPLERLKQRLGLSEMNSGLFLIALTLWGAIFLSLTIGLIWLIWEMVWMGVPEATRATWDFRFALARLAGMTATLGAVVALPFTLVRVRLNAEQTRTAQEGLITDRINKAVEGLGAEKTSNYTGRVVSWKERIEDREDREYPELRDGFTQLWGEGPDIKDRLPHSMRGMTEKEIDDYVKFGDWTEISKTEPNLEVRIGAIYALERIAQDSLRDHVQIMEILCAYIRGNAPAPKTYDWPELQMKEGEEDGSLPADWKERVESFRNEQRARKEGLTCRTDIQVALEVIGRRRAHQRQLEARAGDAPDDAEFVFDRPCPDYDEQEDGHDPEAMKAYLESWKEVLRGYWGYRLDLRNANLRGADLSRLNLNGAKLTGTHLQGARLFRTRLQGANLMRAHLQGALLVQTQLQGADFYEARMQGTFFMAARLLGADLAWVRAQEAQFINARLQGASLLGAALHGANLQEARLQLVDLTVANATGAAVSRADWSRVNVSQHQIRSIFGDGSVILPRGITPDNPEWPPHFPKEVLGQEDFQRAWRRWQRETGFAASEAT